MPYPSPNARTRLPAAGVVAGAVALVAACGCSSMQRRYTPRTLPPPLQAHRVQGLQSVDLSQITRPAARTDLIDHGDLLKFSISAGLSPTSTMELTDWVKQDGTVSLPEIGTSHVAGLNLMQAGQRITAACIQRDLYRHPHVTVSMAQQRVNRITVAGAVNEPGVHGLPRGASYPLDAIIAAGDFTDDAGAIVTIRVPAGPSRLAWPELDTAGPDGVRPAGATVAPDGREPQLVCLNLADEGDRHKAATYLPDGSVVTVDRLHLEPVHVIGLVNKPGRYDFPPDTDFDVFGAIAEAGGVAVRSADKVLVLRRLPDDEGVAAIRVSLRAAKRNAADNVVLAPGDVVSVEQTPATVLEDVVNKILRVGINPVTIL